MYFPCKFACAHALKVTGHGEKSRSMSIYFPRAISTEIWKHKEQEKITENSKHTWYWVGGEKEKSRRESDEKERQ